MVVGGDERAAAAGHRAQLDGVALDLGRRDEGDDLVGAVVDDRRAADPPPAGVEVAEHLALVALGHGDGEHRDRLQHGRPGLLQRLLQPVGGGRAERHVRRVDGVVLAVVALDAHVDDGEPVDPARRHRLLDAALDGRDVLLGDRAADDRVDELGAVAALLGADPEVGDGVLAVTAGLLLDLALGLGRADDRLPVRHPDVLGLDVDAELAGQPLQRHRQVGVAGAAQHGLAGLLVALDDERGILGDQPLQGARQLVVVGLRDRLAAPGRTTGRAPAVTRPAPASPGAPASSRSACRPAWPRRPGRRRRPCPRSGAPCRGGGTGRAAAPRRRSWC